MSQLPISNRPYPINPAFTFWASAFKTGFCFPDPASPAGRLVSFDDQLFARGTGRIAVIFIGDVAAIDIIEANSFADFVGSE